MEDISDNITFLPNPKINYDKLTYIKDKKEIYVNLYEIEIKKDLKLYKYPFEITPNVDKSMTKMKQTVLNKFKQNIKQVYGMFCFSGDSLYSMNKIENISIFKTTIYSKGRYDYTIQIQKFTNEIVIKNEDIQKDNLTKQFIEIIIKDILLSNPKLDFDKGLFVLKEDKKKIETDRVSINFYPGFITRFVETEKGNYINVSLKNKIESTKNILQYLKSINYKNINNQSKIKDSLIGRLFYFDGKKYQIDDILFDRNPKNQTIYKDGKCITILDYYSNQSKYPIKDFNQPLILSLKNGPQGKKLNAFYIPELCTFSGLDDNEQQDGFFMKELSKTTKIDPNMRIYQTNKILDLLIDTKKKDDSQLSPKEKSDLYGIEVKAPKESFTGYIMKETGLIAGNNAKITTKNRTFPVLDKKDMTSWICFYEETNYNDAETLYKCLSIASKQYGFDIAEPEWIEMKDNSTSKDWIDTAEDYFKKKTDKKDKDDNKYTFVIFLLGKNVKIYNALKKHSLCTNGYVSQIVKAKSLKSKGMMSVCSKILLQINSKLGGVSYKTIIDKPIKERKIMVVGVDSSHFGKRTGIAMVSSIDDSFADFYNKEQIIEESKVEQIQFCVSSFLEESIPQYEEKNHEKPKNIIIYRQGVSDNIKNALKIEIQQIEQVCKNHNILFYYILVNTKTTFKFFEKSENNYYNPSAGLLVTDGVVSRDKFEFFIQPQQVTGGSATPTKFNVAYGNMDFPEIIPKFTYDLCHIYSNWQGTVRIPNVIKAAEKLSKMTVKNTKKELNENLSLGQSYL